MTMWSMLTTSAVGHTPKYLIRFRRLGAVAGDSNLEVLRHEAGADVRVEGDFGTELGFAVGYGKYSSRRVGWRKLRETLDRT